MSPEKEELIKKYPSGVWSGHPDFFNLWKACREKEYEENKAAGRPDRLDVFDDCKVPFFTPKGEK